MFHAGRNNNYTNIVCTPLQLVYGKLAYYYRGVLWYIGLVMLLRDC